MKVKVLRAIKYDGKVYEAGEEIDVRKEVVQSLLEVGAIEEVKKPKESQKNKNKKGGKKEEKKEKNDKQ